MGQFSDSGHEPCEECEIGTFNDIEGSTECRECPEGLVAPQRGSVQCVSNDSGKKHWVLRNEFLNQ